MTISTRYSERLESLFSKGVYNRRYDRQLVGQLDVDVIPELDWTKQKFLGVRQEVLKKFSNPQILIATSNMKLVELGDKRESVSGNISATSKELTIIGGSETATGRSWVFFDLPTSANKLYVRASMNSVNATSLFVAFSEASGLVDIDNVNFDGYYLNLALIFDAEDFRIEKRVGGVNTTIAIESVDLTYDTYYVCEFFSDIDNLWAWRDNSLIFDTISGDPSVIEEFNSIQLTTHDNSTTVAQKGRFKGPIVIIYE